MLSTSVMYHTNSDSTGQYTSFNTGEYMYRYVSWIITIKFAACSTIGKEHTKCTFVILTKLQSLYTNTSTRSVEITELRLDKCQIIILTTRTHTQQASTVVRCVATEQSRVSQCMIQRSSAMHQISALCSILLRVTVTTVQQYCKE